MDREANGVFYEHGEPVLWGTLSCTVVGREGVYCWDHGPLLSPIQATLPTFYHHTVGQAVVGQGEELARGGHGDKAP